MLRNRENANRVFLILGNDVCFLSGVGRSEVREIYNKKAAVFFELPMRRENETI